MPGLTLGTLLSIQGVTGQGDSSRIHVKKRASGSFKDTLKKGDMVRNVVIFPLCFLQATICINGVDE